MSYSLRLTAKVLLYAPSHRQDSTYHGLLYTSRAVLAGTRNSSMGPHKGSDNPSLNALLPITKLKTFIFQINNHLSTFLFILSVMAKDCRGPSSTSLNSHGNIYIYIRYYDTNDVASDDPSWATHLSHTWHLNHSSPVWTNECFSKSHFWVKRSPAYGFHKCMRNEKRFLKT